jgi:integrase
MQKAITTELIRNLPPGPVDIWDTKLPRFVVRVRPNGKASYLASLGRGCWHTIGPIDVLTPHEAREEARGLLGDVAKDKSNGRDPIAERKKRKAAARSTVVFKVFLKDHFEPWALEHHKRGKETTQRLRAVFADFLTTKLSDLSPWMFEKWRTTRLKKTGAKPATVNSHLAMLKAALAKAVAWHLLQTNPLADVKPIKADKTGRVRYLTPAEEERLRKALTARDDKRRARREQANAWRRERGYAEWPADNANHLTPIVLLALNTGLRKGEILALCWADVDLAAARLTVRGEGAKSGQTRHVPLNTEAVGVLRDWKAATAADVTEYVFTGRNEGEALDDVKKAWLPLIKAAKVERFVFHDLRHTFASKLVMAGVDLNTVRELLGHADIKMTLRYAHLAPEHKAAAVAKLVPA